MKSTMLKLDEKIKRDELNKISKYDFATVNLIVVDCFLWPDQFFFLELDASIKTCCSG